MIEFVHSVPGRLRVRIAAIRQDRRAAATVRDTVLKIAGIRDATSNQITGSLVVTYDTAELCSAMLWRELQAQLAPFATPSALPAAPPSKGPGWADLAMKTAFESLVGALVERSALALVRAIV
jgi:hypothetical protein